MLARLRKLSPRRAIQTLNARKKELFWAWIAYQSVKGLTTLTLIWIPLWLALRGGG